MDYAPNGDISDYDAEDIADAAMWDGGAEQFLQRSKNPTADQVRARGSSSERRWKDLLLHDWWDYARRIHSGEIRAF